MMDLVNQHKIVPVIDEIFPLVHAHKAFEKMANSNQFGKIILQIA